MPIITKDNSFKIKKIGYFSFFSGLLLLPTASSISIILFFIASTSACFTRKIKFFQDKWNFPFFAAGILMIISATVNTIFLKENILFGYRKDLSWLGLTNWLPFFWCFSPLSTYLENKKLRVTFAKVLICGTIPVLASCIAQYWFEIYGPFKILNGFVTWFQRPIEPMGGVTGLFNNPNYLASWLIAIWPFCVACIFESSRKFYKLFLCLIISFLVLYFLFITYSRNAFLGFFISLPILFGIKKILIFSILLILFCISINVLNNYFEVFELNNILKNSALENLFYKFSNLKIRAALGITRIQIWLESIKIILSRPILGLGVGAFAIILGDSIKINHTHNLFLQISINYGIPAAILIFSNLINILYTSVKKLTAKSRSNEIFDLALITSCLLIFIFQFSDITYFDAKISILFWILFAGLKSYILNSEAKDQREKI